MTTGGLFLVTIGVGLKMDILPRTIVDVMFYILVINVLCACVVIGSMKDQEKKRLGDE